MLLSGWAPRRVEWWLKQRYPDDSSMQISEKTLYSYRKNFVSLKMVLPTPYYEEKINELDVIVDTLRELYNQIDVQKRRVSHNLHIEDDSGVALPDTRKEMELLHTMVADAIELEMKLGIKHAVPARLEVTEKRLDLKAFLVKFLGSRDKPSGGIDAPEA